MDNIEDLKRRILDLEKQLMDVRKEQGKIRKDMDLFEWMLLEEYRILLKLLGEDPPQSRIHSEI
ncbi:hypothetical protein [Risungbinella massiliensis]|uniref:hypothetical protein n=1 Tax=Risungbinella massiliensis TaxID=1329796 RepID=UPI0005CBFF12|nr:hypothetical protein [Risungbinella massiliensis]